MDNYHCSASGSTNSYRITAPLPFGRILVCAECSGTWTQKDDSMRLPLHVATGEPRTRSEILAELGM